MAGCRPRIWPCGITPQLRSKYFYTVFGACRPRTLLFERTENTKKAGLHRRFDILFGMDFTNDLLVLRFYALVVGGACIGRLCNPHRQSLSPLEYKKASLSADLAVYFMDGIYLRQAQTTHHGRLVATTSWLRSVE